MPIYFFVLIKNSLAFFLTRVASDRASTVPIVPKTITSGTTVGEQIAKPSQMRGYIRSKISTAQISMHNKLLQLTEFSLVACT